MIEFAGGLTLIDRIPAARRGGRERLVAIDGLGRFGLAREKALLTGGLMLDFEGEPTDIGAALQLAHGVIAGTPAHVAGPRTHLVLAAALLASAWKIAEIADGLEKLMRENAELRRNAAAPPSLDKPGMRGEGE